MRWLRMLALGLVLAVVGCANTSYVPADTPAKKLALAETQYQAAVDTVTDLANRRLVPEENIPSIVNAINMARASLDIAHEVPTEVNVTTAVGSLRLLQSILDALSRNLKPSGTEAVNVFGIEKALT